MGRWDEELALDPGIVTVRRLHKAVDVRLARAEGGLREESRRRIRVGVIVRPGRRIRGRRKGLRCRLQREITSDFTGGIDRSVDVQVGGATVDFIENILPCNGSGCDVGYDPCIAAVRVRSGSVDVIGDRAAMIAQMDVPARCREIGRKIGKREPQRGDGFIRADTERATAIAASHCTGLRGEASRVEGAFSRNDRGCDVLRKRITGHNLARQRAGIAGLQPADRNVVRASAFLAPDLDVVAAACFEIEQWRHRSRRPIAEPDGCQQFRALQGIHLFLVVADPQLRRLIRSQPELIIPRLRRGDVAADAVAKVIRVRHALHDFEGRKRDGVRRRGGERNGADRGAGDAGPHIAGNQGIGGDDIDFQNRRAGPECIRRSDGYLPGARLAGNATNVARGRIDRPAGRQIDRAIAGGRAARDDLVMIQRRVFQQQHAERADNLRRCCRVKAGGRDVLLGLIRALPAKIAASRARILIVFHHDRVADSRIEIDRAGEAVAGCCGG